MKSFLTKPIITLMLVWSVICVGVFLRAWQADKYPVDNNDDGLHYTWAGISFLTNPFKPSTHSIFDAKNKALKWRSQYMDYIPRMRFGLKIVEPWQDHPPLGAAIIGLPAYLLGFRQFELVPQMIVRLPALFLSILTMYLTYLVSKDWFNKRVAVWSLGFLATVPYFVMAHRQSFLENILTPVFLASVYFLKRKTKWSMTLSFFTGWIKLVGFAVPIMLGVWLWCKGKKDQSLKFLMVGGLSVASYLIYALVVSKEVFFNMVFNQGGRGAFVSSFLNGLTVIEFYGPFRDGWYVLGLILALMLLVKQKPKAFAWFFSAWLVVIFLTSGRLANSPWYRYPLIPFMSMGLGYYANQLIKKPSLFLMLPFWLLGLTGFDLIKLEIPTLGLRLATVLFLGIFGLKLLFPTTLTKKLAKITTKLFLIGLILLNIIVSLRFSTIHCTYEECLAPFKLIVEK